MENNTLSARINLILKEQKLKKVTFAKTLGVSDNYIYMLTAASSRLNSIGGAMALLIEEKYGYSARWVLTGEGPREARPPGAPEEGGGTG